jgi:hypothetical protein
MSKVVVYGSTSSPRTAKGEGMNIRRALSVTKRIFRGLRNDRRTVGLMFIGPIIAMCVFGLAFSGDVKDVHVVVVNQDEGYQPSGIPVPVSISKMIIANFDKDVLKVDYVNTEEEGVKRVKEGGAYGLIVFPEHFTRDIYTKIQNPSLPLSTTIQVRLDRSNVNVANAITKNITDAVLQTIKETGNAAPISVDADNAIYGKGAKFMDFFVPGIMAFVVFLLTTLLTLISFVGETYLGQSGEIAGHAFEGKRDCSRVRYRLQHNRHVADHSIARNRRYSIQHHDSGEYIPGVPGHSAAGDCESEPGHIAFESGEAGGASNTVLPHYNSSYIFAGGHILASGGDTFVAEIVIICHPAELCRGCHALGDAAGLGDRGHLGGYRGTARVCGSVPGVGGVVAAKGERLKIA